MEVRAFLRLAGVFLSVATGACHTQDRPAGSTADDPSTSGTPSFGDLPPPDEPTTSSTGGPETGSTGLSSTGVASTGSSEYCGDGVVQEDEGEECDLGADNSDIGPCTNACKNAVCGDGFIRDGLEECDDGAGNSPDYGSCSPECEWNSYCGDGLVDPEFEQCDLAELNGTGESNEGEVPCSAACLWLARIVFLSSDAYTGSLGGVSGADLKCRALAKGAGLVNAGKFRAWISDTVNNPLSRFDQTGVDGLPYAMRNGKIIAANFLELTEDGPRTGISITEKGTTLLQEYVWTNTTAFGETFIGETHCSEWTSNNAQLKGRMGLNAVTVEQGPDWEFWRDERHWTSHGVQTCFDSARLYCFEDGSGGAD
jgi:hypothetical protein